MIKTYSNKVHKNEINKILSWMYEKDHYSDDRPQAYSKLVNINDDDWPKEKIYTFLKRINLKDNIEFVTFFEQRENLFGLHADTGDGDQKTLGKNILIPLEFNDNATTVIFKNKWLYSKVKFYKAELTPNGDITQCTDFDINKDIDEKTYIKYLQHIDRKKLKGLEIEQIYNWKLGDILVFDRQHIHSAGFLTKPKKSLVIFTTKL